MSGSAPQIRPGRFALWRCRALGCPALVAEVKRLHEHSVSLNQIAWKVAVALGDAQPDAETHVSDPKVDVDRLLARIAEDERYVKAFLNYGSWLRADHQTGSGDRILAECEAKRIIVNVYLDLAARSHADEPGSVQWHEAEAYRTSLRALALPYADHPDYREEWRS